MHGKEDQNLNILQEEMLQQEELLQLIEKKITGLGLAMPHPMRSRKARASGESVVMDTSQPRRKVAEVWDDLGTHRA